ncbi:type III restriction endonuclease subunit M [Gordonia sp. (in: high G+C Gram-positive bacteria)]|uniref:type III restriction endonuclease subunit M n=1 Tax=Gordonia sp. (in: high G+C Gram-positive bacteria) TaxID=84139 RepID=UPI00257D6226|nr:type III restriction endonuclease subunit M [Gordonia sp. (in: high G+C Gram-positive bacteria)]
MQIKTRQRVRDLAEVYTHSREVTAMLDLVPDMFPSAADPANTDRKFFEPAAGSGNFLEEILVRKLAYVTATRYRSTLQYEHRVLRALASIYAVDIDAENVAESKERLRSVIVSHLDNDLNTKEATPGFAGAVEAILETNLILANTLTDLDTIEWVDYRAGRNGTFTREWSTVNSDMDQLDLFHTPKVDGKPVHYALLLCNPAPVTGEPKRLGA